MCTRGLFVMAKWIPSGKRTVKILLLLFFACHSYALIYSKIALCTFRVESLNSVLDDNRLLTMPSGERIQFGDNVNFLFETDDLSSASPATVSRMGMIFLSEEDLDVGSLVDTWLVRQPEEHRQVAIAVVLG